MSMKRAVSSALLCLLPVAVCAAEFRLSSPDLQDGGQLPPEQILDGFGCVGPNLSPALTWENVPPGTQSLAVTLYDPDAPTGSGWWHWVVINIPVDTLGLAAGAGNPARHRLPGQAVQARTDFGTPGYGGACPPVGDRPHRYVFTVYALKIPRINLPETATAALAGFMIQANVIARATLTVHYGR